MSRFVDCGRDQAFPLPPDLRDWILEDDLAHFLIGAVERVDMSAFKVNRRGSGSTQCHPLMMLALLIYCCGHRGHCVLAGRGLYQCNRCKKQTSPTAGTIFPATKLPLRLWFEAIDLIVTARMAPRRWNSAAGWG